MEAVPATSQCRYSRGGGRLAYNPGRSGQAHLRSPPQPVPNGEHRHPNCRTTIAFRSRRPRSRHGPASGSHMAALTPFTTAVPAALSTGSKSPGRGLCVGVHRRMPHHILALQSLEQLGGEAVFAGRGVLKAGRQAHFQLREGALAHAVLPLLGYERGCTSTLHPACSDAMAVALGTAMRCRIRACPRRVACGGGCQRSFYAQGRSLGWVKSFGNRSFLLIGKAPWTMQVGRSL